MSKLGYTFYPKDWGNSEAVFELNLTLRGLYRELIDLAMLQDNKVIINVSVWCRKWDVTKDDLIDYLNKLEGLKLIEIDNENIFIPSCENRLKLVRGGRNGGKKSKPIVKPYSKPIPKPIANQIETKREIETKTETDADDFIKQIADGSHQMWVENLYMKFKLKKGSIGKLLKDFNTHLGIQEKHPKTLKDYKEHFYNWLNTQERVGKLGNYSSKKVGAL